MKSCRYISCFIVMLCCLVVCVGCQAPPKLAADIPEITSSSAGLLSAPSLQERKRNIQKNVEEEIVYIVTGEYEKDSNTIWYGTDMHNYHFKLVEDIRGNFPDDEIVVNTPSVHSSWIAEPGKTYLLMLTEYRNVYEEGCERLLGFPPILLDNKGELIASTAIGTELLSSLKIHSKEQLLNYVDRLSPKEPSQNIDGIKFTNSSALGDIVEISDLIISVRISELANQTPTRETFYCEILETHIGDATARPRIAVPPGWFRCGETYLLMLCILRNHDGTIAYGIDGQENSTIYCALAAPNNSYFPLTDTEKVAEVLQLVEQLK